MMNIRPSLACAIACATLRGQPTNLDIHLQRRHAVRRARDLEVHVAHGVLNALDIGQNRLFAGGLALAVIRPIATPATGALIGTPASISESVLPQVEPIEVEPFELSTSETTRIV